MKGNHILIEIIVSILVLAVVGIFSVRMFVQAGNMQSKARDLDLAVLAAQSAVEVFKADYSYQDTIYLDKEFNAAFEYDPKGFILTTKITDDQNGLFDIDIEVKKAKPYFMDSETHVFSLSTAVYKGGAIE